MFRVVFIRHGEAAPAHGGDDRSRGLTSWGRNKVSLQAALLGEQNLAPDLILTSDAKRTVETSKILQTQFTSCEIRTSPQLYLADFGSLQSELKNIKTPKGTFFLVGHNPGWSDIASQLTGNHVGLGPGDFCSCLYTGKESLSIAITEVGYWQKEDLQSSR